MGFRSKVFLTVLLILADCLATTLRSTWTQGGDFEQYLWVAGHLAIGFLEGVMMFAFFSGTIWFTAGLLGEMLFSIKATLPLWLLRTFFIQMPWTYNHFVSDTRDSPWESSIYAAFFCLDLLFALLFWTSLMYTVSCMTDRRMYAPYHKEICVQLMAQYQQARLENANAAGNSQGGVNTMVSTSGGALAGAGAGAGASAGEGHGNVRVAGSDGSGRRTVVKFA